MAKQNRKSFYGGTDAQSNTHDIEMPPLPDQVQTPMESSDHSIPSEPELSVQSNPQPEQLPDQELVEQVESAPEPKKTQQDNFKAIREAKDKAEREKEMLMEEVLRLRSLQATRDKMSQVEQPIIDDNIDFSLDEEGLVEGKHVKKVTNRIKKLESILKQQDEQNKLVHIESKIRNQFPDFEKVVSKENVEMLNAQFPEMAQVLRDTSDVYSKAVSAYSVMKQYGIYKDDTFLADKAKAIANAQKPKPLISANPQQGDSPLSKANAFANGLTPELAVQLRKEMEAARKAH